MSISPKLSNSLPLAPPKWRQQHLVRQQNDAVVRRLVRDYAYQLKFVVDAPADLVEIAAYLERFPEVAPERVWLMPQGIASQELAARTNWLAPWAAERGFRVSPRRHIERYGHRRGT
jgi:7-carboxy-7-deazaguanine synthase